MATRAETAQKKRAFAVAYATPGTAAFNNAAEAWLLAVDPGASRDTARRAGSRYLDDPAVKAVIAETRKAAGTLAGMTVEKFVQECLANEKRMIELTAEEGRGTAQAAAKYREMAGKALGLFVQITEDRTPKPPPMLPSTPEQAAVLVEAAQRLQELMQPLPLPKQITATAAGQVAEAEFEVVTGDENGSGHDENKNP